MRPVRFEDRGGWVLARSRPHPVLRPFLDAYHGYWEYEVVPSWKRTVPGGSAVMIINLGPPLRLTTPGGPDADHGSFLAGMYDRHGSYTSPGGQRGVQLDLTPLGAYTLTGVPMGRLTNIATDLRDLVGPSAAELTERLHEAPGWPARFDLLDAYWLRRLEAGPSPAAEVERAWHVLTATGGRAPVTALADDVGWSRKHLHHRFKEQVGLPPKVMARVLRFQRAVERMAAGGLSWAGIAADCGYYDQAHLNREVRALAGCTPTELLAAERPEQPSTSPWEFPERVR